MPNPLRTAAALRRRSIMGLDNTGSSGFNYTGAGYNRLTSDWIGALIASADQEARWDLYRLRARARDLVRNNPYAARYIEMVGENVIGEKGIRLQPQVTRPDGSGDTGINDRIAEGWKDWCHPESASASGELSFVDAEWMAIGACAMDGESLFRLLPGFPYNEHRFTIQQLDIDLLDHTYNRPPEKNRNEIRMGVELDGWGRRVAYHLWTAHPYDLNGGYDREREAVPASQIIHLRRSRRPGQTRDVTWFAPVMLPLRMLHGFAEAELIAARTAASQMGFFLSDEEAEEDPDSPFGEGDQQIEAEPGMFMRAPAGTKDIKLFSPNHPNAQFQQFVKAMVRWIAGGLSVSYNGLANDLESVNYSSIRAGLLSERDHWRRLQTWMSQHFHRPIYREWLKWQVTAGVLELPARNVDRWFNHRWLYRGWAWVDPLKDITAAAAELQLSLQSRTRLAAETGDDLEEIWDDVRAERALATEKGIVLVDVIGTATVKEQTTATDQGGEIVPAAEAQDAADSADASTARALEMALGALRDTANRQAVALGRAASVPPAAPADQTINVAIEAQRVPGRKRISVLRNESGEITDYDVTEVNDAEEATA